MAGLKGALARDLTLDAWLGPTRSLGPATLYMALFTTAVGSNGSGSEVSTSGTGYSRKAVDNDTAFMIAASGGQKAITVATNFFTPSSPALTDCGTVIWAALVYTASGALTGDDLLYAGPLASSNHIQAGNSFTVPIGGAVFKEL